jgi:hypothetical protein
VLNALRERLYLLILARRGALDQRSPDSRFATTAPTPQTAVDSAAVPWVSRLPIPGVVAGVAGASCLELGPLEGGHSYALDRARAERVVAIEANKDAFLKCLVAKELLGMRSCSFLCGDVIAYLESTTDKYDVCWCAGILYHMVDPVRLLELVSTRAPKLYIWTHYFDAEKLRGNPTFANGQHLAASHDGFAYQLHRQQYGVGRRLRVFSGGTQPHSNWLSLRDLLRALEHFGWADLQTQLEDHPNGPAVSLVAKQRG